MYLNEPHILAPQLFRSRSQFKVKGHVKEKMQITDWLPPRAFMFHKHIFSFQGIIYAVDQYLRSIKRKKKNATKKEKQQEKNSKPLINFHSKTYLAKLKREPFVFGKTIALHFEVMNAGNDPLLMVSTKVLQCQFCCVII